MKRKNRGKIGEDALETKTRVSAYWTAGTFVGYRRYIRDAKGYALRFASRILSKS